MVCDHCGKDIVWGEFVDIGLPSTVRQVGKCGCVGTWDREYEYTPAGTGGGWWIPRSGDRFDYDRVGTCSKCGGRADVNTPCLAPGGKLLCDQCANKDRSNRILRGVEQHRDRGGRCVKVNRFMLNGSIVGDYGGDIHAYLGNGHTAFPLTDEEKKLSPVTMLKRMNKEYVAKGKYRCTDCSKDITEAEVAGRPLFAGICCADCWKKHQAHLEDQRRRGAVCSMCHRPYDDCAC